MNKRKKLHNYILLKILLYPIIIIIIYIIPFLLFSCALLSPSLKKHQEQSVQSITGAGSTTVNDPQIMNIMAYFIGGTMLLAALGNIYYTRTRVKQNARN